MHSLKFTSFADLVKSRWQVTASIPTQTVNPIWCLTASASDSAAEENCAVEL